MNADQRVKNLGIHLPAGSGPAGNYATVVQTGGVFSLRNGVPLTLKATIEVKNA